jgi:hypothetical protein
MSITSLYHGRIWTESLFLTTNFRSSRHFRIFHFQSVIHVYPYHKTQLCPQRSAILRLNNPKKLFYQFSSRGNSNCSRKVHYLKATTQKPWTDWIQQNLLSLLMDITATSRPSELLRLNKSSFWKLPPGNTHIQGHNSLAEERPEINVFMGFNLFRAQTKLIFFQRQKNNKLNVAVQDVTIFTRSQQSSHGHTLTVS